MRYLFCAIAVGVLMACGCGAGTTFAPSLREQPRPTHQFPWWEEVLPDDSGVERLPPQPEAQQDYESPIRVNCLEISHSGRWRLATGADDTELFAFAYDDIESGRTTNLVTDRGWNIAISRVSADTPAEEIREVEEGIRMMFGFIAVMSAPSIIQQNPELFEGLSNAEAMDRAIELVINMLNPQISPAFSPENSEEAASLRIAVENTVIQVFGVLTDYENEASGVVVMGVWPRDEDSPVPLMDLTQITRNLRIIEDCE